MRLAQLARKISVKPSEITEFLATHNIQLDNSSNAKVNDEHVDLVFRHFAPEMLGDAKASDPNRLDQQKETESEHSSKIETSSEIVSEPAAISSSEEWTEVPEVIKPIKVELPGLKVVGKIDLPEPKKKEKSNDSGDKIIGDKDDQPAKDPSDIRVSRAENKRLTKPKREVTRKPRKNPIALQREREEREALRRKLEEKKKEKELRTHRYLKKVSTKPVPPKSIKKVNNEDEYETYSEEMTKPKSFIGRILSWFVSE